MKTSRIGNHLGLAAILVGILFMSQATQAATYYWDTNGATLGPGTTPSGTWTVGGNWNALSTGDGTLGTAPGASDTAYFTAGASGAQAGTTSYTVSLGDASVSVLGMNFGSTAPTVIGSAVGDGTITIGTGGITTNRNANGGGSNNAHQVTIKSNVNLDGNQTWNQNTGVSAGGLVIQGEVGGTGNLMLLSSANRPFTISGNVNHTGSLTMGTSSNSLTISGNIGSNVSGIVSTSNVMILSGENSYSGNVSITGANSNTATLRIGNNSAIVPTSTITLNSATAASQSRLDLGNGANSFNATVAGLLTAGSGRQGRSVVTNSSSGTGTGTLTINPAAASNFNGLIQDGSTAKVAISVGGADTLTLSGANSYTGGTTVSSGTLAVSAQAATVTDVTVSSIASGTVTQTATVADTTGLAIGQAISAPNLAGGTFIIGITSGTTLQLSAAATGTGTQSGTFSAYQTLGSGAVTASGTGVLDLSGSTTSSVGTVTVSGGTIQNGTLTGTSYLTSSGSISANLAGSGVTLTQNGAGTTTLTGVNSYTGATQVTNGTLLVNSTGSINSSSGVAVNGGTFRYDGTTGLDRNVTLDGGKFSYNSATNYGGALTYNSGTIAGSNLAGVALSIDTGKIMSPGNSTGTMTAGATTWATGGSFLFELNDTTGTAGSTSLGWDLLNAASLDITAGVGEFTIQIASLNGSQAAGNALNFDGTSNYKWLFVDAGSNITSFDASLFTINDSAFTNSTPGSFSISQGDGLGGDLDKLYINYAGVIPEPSSYALLICGLGLLAFLRRKANNDA